jgi:hypothetical protein
MSLIDDKRTHSNKVILAKDKATLILTRELVNKIHLTHHFTDSKVEWSGILKYKVTEGSLDDPANMVIVASDFLLMDIQSPTYTEYDFESDDSKMLDFIMDCSIDGSKYGHLHSHNSMRCFFSGTDMSELHDNAPNHNYYLSLIVNKEKDGNTNWCAKVAYISEEVETGTKRVKNSFTRVKTFINGLGKQTSEEVVDNEEEVEINVKTSYLNTIDLTITEERSNEYQWDLERFDFIKAKVRKPVISLYSSATYGPGYNYSHGSIGNPRFASGVKKATLPVSGNPITNFNKKPVKTDDDPFQINNQRYSQQALFTEEDDGWDSYALWGEEIDLTKTEVDVSDATIAKLKKALEDKNTIFKAFMLSLFSGVKVHGDEASMNTIKSFKDIESLKITNPHAVDDLYRQIETKYITHLHTFFAIKKEDKYFQEHVLSLGLLMFIKESNIQSDIKEMLVDETAFYVQLDGHDMNLTVGLLDVELEDLPWENL